MNDGLFYSISQAAELLKVNPETIRRRIRRGRIKAQLLPGPRGDQYSIPASELHMQEAELVPVSQLPQEVVKQIAEACANANAEAITRAVEAVVLPLQEQIQTQQQVMQIQMNDIIALQEQLKQQAETATTAMNKQMDAFVKATTEVLAVQVSEMKAMLAAQVVEVQAEKEPMVTTPITGTRVDKAKKGFWSRLFG